VRPNPPLVIGTSSNRCNSDAPFPLFYVIQLEMVPWYKGIEEMCSLFYVHSLRSRAHICRKLASLLGLRSEGKFARSGFLHKLANHLRIVRNDELNIVLLKLVGYLGHSNPIVSGVAFNEVGETAWFPLSCSCSVDTQTCQGW
jgi:hypothetical protein